MQSEARVINAVVVVFLFVKHLHIKAHDLNRSCLRKDQVKLILVEFKFVARKLSAESVEMQRSFGLT